MAAADAESPLGGDDLHRLAVAAHLTGHDQVSVDTWSRGFHLHADRGDAPAAARCAFWLTFVHGNKGEAEKAGGWWARGQRLLDEGGLDCVERGYLVLAEAITVLFGGDPAAARKGFASAAATGDRFGDADLIAMARQAEGRTLIILERVAEGTALLDEVMVSVEAGEVSPIVAGNVYCSVIEACQELFDVRRAAAWTAALSDWCGAQPGLVMYRGQCMVHRSEIMLLRGEWPEAMDETERACARLADPPWQPAIGAAYYQRAELHRLRGDRAASEDGYRRASRWGKDPQPGLALLRLAQGDVEAATAAIRRAHDEASDVVSRSRLLPALVEVALAAGDLDAARAGTVELASIAGAIGSQLLAAAATRAAGAVRLADGDPAGALGELRRALIGWQALEAPYEVARTRVLIGLACRALNDSEGSALELDAARRTFERLGAVPDLARLEPLAPVAPPPGGLTAREMQVLVLLATGRTNRAIADELVISEKTVARHVSNIFAKLGLSSRSAATAFAYRHHLV
jgi:DNA-binding CsgD family transcriptional regulator